MRWASTQRNHDDSAHWAYLTRTREGMTILLTLFLKEYGILINCENVAYKLWLVRRVMVVRHCITSASFVSFFPLMFLLLVRLRHMFSCTIPPRAPPSYLFDRRPPLHGMKLSFLASRRSSSFTLLLVYFTIFYQCCIFQS